MSVTIFKDVEEAIAREVRRITTHSARTLDKTILKETYDPLSGELIQMPIEPEFYDSSADAGTVEYPHFFIRLMKTREDRFTGRVVPEYGRNLICPVKYSPKAFQIVIYGAALINSLGNDLTTSAFQIRKIQPGHLIRLLEGNNKGTYIVSSITISNVGDHTITVSSTLVNTPELVFNSTLRQVKFMSDVDISTVRVGDQFTDAASNTYNITAIDASNGLITIDGSTTPDSSVGGVISRAGNVLLNTDLTPVKYIVLDPAKPVYTADGAKQASSSYSGISPAIPIDAFYLVRIDSKTRQNHIDTLNRVWEEFNPPRTALPIIVRSALSADQELTADIPVGGSTTVQIADNTNYNVGDTVYIFDDLTPTKRPDGEGFLRPFESIIVDKISTNQLILKDVVPDIYKMSNTSRIVSNATVQLSMFHFVDHVTKDVEGSQYWVHEFTFWTQVWIDKLETPKQYTNITDIASDIEDIDTQIILSDE